MISTTDAMIRTGILLIGMVLLAELGRRLGRRRLAAEGGGPLTGTGAVEGAVFGLLGLMIAFTFSGAAARLDTRRQLAVQEANAIGTAYLRVDLLPADAQPVLRDLFREYVESRIKVYRSMPDIAAAFAELERSAALQGKIWKQCVSACERGGSPTAGLLLLPALNEMIDIVTTRTIAAQTHPPRIIFSILGALGLISALLAGYATGGSPTRRWMHVLTFAAVVAVTSYVILDLEYPRVGLIRIDALDQLLVDLRASMK